ncbi:MAG: CoA transferase subunit A [Gammaproteobacteria bacterium]
MAEITKLSEAISALIHDGDSVITEGFTHLIPHAAGHEIVRQSRQELCLIKMTPDIICDQIIGMGLVRQLRFSWGGNPGVGSLHRLRDAVENAWPRPIKLAERSHADLATAYAAGAGGLPFGVIRGYTGTDLSGKNSDEIRPINCPFSGEKLMAVKAVNADVAVIHAQRADRRGNVQLWGIMGIQKEAVLCAQRSIVTVEEVVDELEPVPDQVILPGWIVTAVCEVPGGAHPSYTLGYDKRDNQFYSDWDAISRDREGFRHWMERHVLGTDDFEEFKRSLGAAQKQEHSGAS